MHVNVLLYLKSLDILKCAGEINLKSANQKRYGKKRYTLTFENEVKGKGPGTCVVFMWIKGFINDELLLHIYMYVHLYVLLCEV